LEFPGRNKNLLAYTYKRQYISAAVQHLSPEDNDVDTRQTTCKYLAINIPRIMGRWRGTYLKFSYWSWTTDT